MSFDVSICRPACSVCGRGNESVYDFNITHNLNEIVERTLAPSGLVGNGDRAYRERSWGRLEGHSVQVVRIVMEAAEKILLDPERQKEWRTLEPSNGWGTVDDVVHTYQRFRQELQRAEEAWIIEAHG